MMEGSSTSLPQGFLQYFSDDPNKTSIPLQPLAAFDLSTTQIVDSGDLKRPKSFGLSNPSIGLVEFACPTNSVRSTWIKALSEVSEAVRSFGGRGQTNSAPSTAFRAPVALPSQRPPIESSFRQLIPAAHNNAHNPTPAIGLHRSGMVTSYMPNMIGSSSQLPSSSFHTPQPPQIPSNAQHASMLPPAPMTSSYVPPPPSHTYAVPTPVSSYTSSAIAQPAAIRKPSTSSVKKDRPKEPKELPRWVPGNYNTSKAFVGSANKNSTAKPTNVSPQRIRRGANTHDQVETLQTPHARSSSAPPVSQYANSSPYASGQHYPNGMPPQPHSSYNPANFSTPQAAVPQQYYPNMQYNQTTAFGGPSAGSSVDNLTIGQLKEALLSIPKDIRSSLISDVSDNHDLRGRSDTRGNDSNADRWKPSRVPSRDRRRRADDSPDDFFDSRRGGFSEFDDKPYEAEDSESGYERRRNSVRRHSRSMHNTEADEDGVEEHKDFISGASEYSPKEAPSGRPGMGDRQMSSRTNYVTPIVERPAPMRRAQSTPPSTSKAQRATTNMPRSSNQVASGPRDRASMLEWSKKQAQSKYLSKEAGSGATLKSRTRQFSPQRSSTLPPNRAQSSIEQFRSKSAGRGAIPKIDANNMGRSSSAPRSKSLGAQSFFDFKKSLATRGKAQSSDPHQEDSLEQSPDAKKTSENAPSVGSSVLLNSNFVRSNQNMLQNYRHNLSAADGPHRDSSKGPPSASAGNKPTSALASSYEAIRARTGLMSTHGAHPAPRPSGTALGTQSQGLRGPNIEAKTPVRPTLQKQGSNFSAARNNDAMTDLAEWQRFTQWLESIGMEHYVSEMREHGVTKLSIIELLAEDDLIQIGVDQEDIPIILRKVSDLTQRIRSFSDAFNLTSADNKFINGLVSPGSPPNAQSPVEVNIKTVRRDLLRAFDHGDLDKFFGLWQAFIALVSPDAADNLIVDRQAFEFHLHLHFCVLPMKTNMSMGKILHAKEALRRYLDSTQSNIYTNRTDVDNALEAIEGEVGGDLKSTMERMTSSKEFATFAGLVFVPYPQLNPAFQSLFKDEWTNTLRVRLEENIDKVLHQLNERRGVSVPVSAAAVAVPPPRVAPIALDSPKRIDGTPPIAGPDQLFQERIRPEDLTDGPPTPVLVKPTVQRFGGPVARPSLVNARVVGGFTDIQPSVSTDVNDAILSPMAEPVDRERCHTPNSIASSISQLTDDTPLKTSSPRKVVPPLPSHQAASAPTSSALADAANRAASKLKVLGRSPASPSRTALQAQVDNYNRLLKQNRLGTVSTVPASSAPVAQGHIPIVQSVSPPGPPAPVNFSQPVTAQPAREGLKAVHRFNLGVTGRAVDVDQVNRYKALLASKQNSSVAANKPSVTNQPVPLAIKGDDQHVENNHDAPHQVHSQDPTQPIPPSSPRSKSPEVPAPIAQPVEEAADLQEAHYQDTMSAAVEETEQLNEVDKVESEEAEVQESGETAVELPVAVVEPSASTEVTELRAPTPEQPSEPTVVVDNNLPIEPTVDVTTAAAAPTADINVTTSAESHPAPEEEAEDEEREEEGAQQDVPAAKKKLSKKQAKKLKKKLAATSV